MATLSYHFLTFHDKIPPIRHMHTYTKRTESTIPSPLLSTAKLFRTYRDLRSRDVEYAAAAAAVLRPRSCHSAIVSREPPYFKTKSPRDHCSQFLMRHKKAALISKFSLFTSAPCGEARNAGATPAITIVQRVTAPLYMSDRKFIVVPTPGRAGLGTMCNAINPRN